jgi:hypothetical protein
MAEKNNVNRLSKGISTDVSPIDQKQGTYRYAKNAVLESRDGDIGFLSNELGNEVCALFPTGYTPIGKEYMTNGEVAIFLVSLDDAISEIGILKDNCSYETVVNTDLGFKIRNQIDVTYRLRRGCERTVYFTDGANKPRIFNFDSPEDFQDGGGAWVESKFNLFKIYNSIPRFSNIEIAETGQLPPGSYNAAIQYLDEDFNPTEWINTTDTVIIYNDNGKSKPFKDVRGSTNAITDYQDFGDTNKSIKFTLSNLDETFLFYRIAIIEANNGSGNVSRVVFSGEISTQVTSYTYTGTNGQTEGTVQEIQQFNNIIESAKHIEQIENRLILSGTQGKQINYCRLQKYASRIKANLVTESVVLNDLTFENNQKRPEHHLEKVGYMPGEIYSFGIVWVFDDGTTSPVYHIPGRASTYNSLMSSDNVLENSFYTENDSCSGEDFWGYDSQGTPLKDTAIRHHRFPLRSEVNKPLVTSLGSSTELTQNVLSLTITGTIADPPVSASTMEVTVNYTIDAAPASEVIEINTETYDPVTGILNLQITTNIGVLVFVDVLETPDGGGPGVDPSTNSTLTYVGTVTEETVILNDIIYTSEIFGINFSDIDVPNADDLNGEVVVGYYIVRNKREEVEKTILDTGVITPLLEEKRAGVSKFVSFGHIAPESTDLKDDVFALVHPEHKFRQKEYTGVTELIQEGEYVITSRNVSSRVTQDVLPGTSYDSSVNKRRERDSDGFDLHTITRNNNVTYNVKEGILAEQADINEVFYLDSLFSKTITDLGGDRKDIFNMSGDNKTGILHLNKTLDTVDLRDNLPYVVMKRTLTDPYGNFRVLPYYKENANIINLSGATDNTVTIFNGDSYISSMRYVSSSYYDLRIKDRDRKSGALNFIIGVLGVLVGAVLIATGVGAAAGIAVIGLGVTQLATGFKVAQASRVYQDLYDQGLQDTVDDDATQQYFAPDPQDDELQWMTDVVTNLWFESSVNMNWRQGNTVGLTDFLSSPGDVDTEALNSYALEKVTNIDPSADGGRNYQGYCKAEIYEVNADYFRRDREKIFFHLALEYDCCTKCLEQFPHRTYNSEQSFQEELTDNYRVFLPNNYRDMEGETGIITNVFRIQNNLYIHTEEALWHLPQNIQERVTGDIISFIGTGSFFSIPPRKILDDESGNSAGTQHKWGMLKTPHGVFFISASQNIVYKFNGNNLVPISNLGEYSWFKENITSNQDETYFNDTGEQYPYKDNPSNDYGTGFILTYDSKFERVLVTKKDFLIDSGLLNSTDGDYTICVYNGQLLAHLNISETIAAEALDGWYVTGMNDICYLCFERLTTEIIETEVASTVPNEADIHVFYDTSGSFGGINDSCLTSIDDAIDEWIVNYALANPDWTGTVYKYEDNTERWINYPQIIASTTYSGVDLSTKDIIVISFCNEATPVYHGSSLDDPIAAPTTAYLDDFNNFKTLHGSYKSFIGVAYPIVFGTDAGSCGTGGGSVPSSKNFLSHSIAATFGTPLTLEEVASELGSQNPGFTVGEWADLKVTLQGTNPYPDDGLRDYGWAGKWDRAANASGDVIDSVQFQADMEDILAGTIVTEIVEVAVPVFETQCLPPTPLVSATLLDCSCCRRDTAPRRGAGGHAGSWGRAR